MKKATPSKKTESPKKTESELFIQLRFLLKKEILFGLLFVILGVTLLFRKLLDIQLDVVGIFAAFFFILGVWFHLKSIREKDFIKLFLLGQMFLLLSLTFSQHLIPLGLESVFILFILFLLSAASALGYTMHPDKPMLIVLSVLTLLLIGAYLMSSEAPLRIHGTAGIWFIAYLFFYMSSAKPQHSRPFLIISGLFFLIGFVNISSQIGRFIPIFILWFLGAASLLLYLKKRKHWILLVLTFIFLMSGFAVFNESLNQIFPEKWINLLWLAGFSALFYAIWHLSKKDKPQKWSFWFSVVFAINACIIFVADIVKLQGEVIISLIMIIIGSWLIYSKAIKQGKKARKN